MYRRASACRPSIFEEALARAICGRPARCKWFLKKVGHVVGCCHLSGLCSDGAAGLYGSSRIGTKSLRRALSTMSPTGSSDPVSPTVVPYSPSTDYTSDDLRFD